MEFRFMKSEPTVTSSLTSSPLLNAGAVFPLQQPSPGMGVEHLRGGGQRKSGRAQVSLEAPCKLGWDSLYPTVCV